MMVPERISSQGEPQMLPATADVPNAAHPPKSGAITCASKGGYEAEIARVLTFEEILQALFDFRLFEGPSCFRVATRGTLQKRDVPDDVNAASTLAEFLAERTKLD
eukprot:scpid97127/ scgid32592/ 